MVDGKRHYGDGLYKKASKIIGLDEAYLRKIKSIADRYELYNRLYNLSWRHHEEVAPIKKLTEDTKGKLQLSNEPDIDKISEFSIYYDKLYYLSKS